MAGLGAMVETQQPRPGVEAAAWQAAAVMRQQRRLELLALVKALSVRLAQQVVRAVLRFLAWGHPAREAVLLGQPGRLGVDRYLVREVALAAGELPRALLPRTAARRLPGTSPMREAS